MKINTRIFGEIDVADDKVITFTGGIIGFPEYKSFTLLHDEGEGGDSICWLQSLDEPQLALPVMDPLLVKPGYSIQIEEDHTKILGEMTEENTFMLVTLTVPEQPELLSVNLKAPIVVNTDTRQAGQWIIEDDFPVKYQVYDVLKNNQGEGE